MTELPTTFGKYFLTEKLAIGGMAEIYLAKLVGPGGFEKQLVIKKIHPKLSGQRHFVDLFVTEAKTLVTLAHGNIVPVYELGVIDDTYFIAMEYIDGPTLYRLTETLARKDEAMAPALAAWITARILDGLDYAHRKGDGVIHRDLSPRNVMLSRDGEVKLVDFGIAVTLGAADDGKDLQATPSGSFPYMSPEQVRREPLSGQTDLFSAGVLMWEMLVGQRLFARPDPDATLAAVTADPITRPSMKRPDIPSKLDDIVMRALDRDQHARWPSAGEMLGALQRYLYGLDTTPGPRDLSALVARACPPETRRLPTHSDPVESTEAPPPALGPSTAVLPRDAPISPNKRARTETFATHVELEHMLGRGTPIFPIPAIPDEPAPATEPGPQAKSGPASADHDPKIAVASMPRPPAPPLPTIGIPGRTAPTRALLVLAALGTFVLGAVAIVTFVRSRDRVLAPDAGVPDAFVIPGTGIVIESPDAALTASPAIADALVDAASVPLDAAATSIPVPRDAGSRPRGDTGAVVDSPPRATGTATLKIGAEPWGEIVIDGTPRGRTPAELELAAGKHVVEVIFRGDDPPRTRRFPIELTTGEVEQVHADFTKP